MKKIILLSVLVCGIVVAQESSNQTAAPEAKASAPSLVVAPSKEAPPKKIKSERTNAKANPTESNSITQSKEASAIKPYKIRKSVIKEQVDAMKTEVLSQKTQSVILKDLLKKEGLDGSKRPLIISFKNTLGSRYIVDSVTYKLNGEVIYQFIADEQSDVKPELRSPKNEIQTTVVPGPYSLEVLIVYRGNDTGVFSYLKDYRITRENRFKLDVKKVNETRVEVQTFESGSVFSDFKDRPQLKISQI